MSLLYFYKQTFRKIASEYVACISPPPCTTSFPVFIQGYVYHRYGILSVESYLRNVFLFFYETPMKLSNENICIEDLAITINKTFANTLVVIITFIYFTKNEKQYRESFILWMPLLQINLILNNWAKTALPKRLNCLPIHPNSKYILKLRK